MTATRTPTLQLLVCGLAVAALASCAAGRAPTRESEKPQPPTVEQLRARLEHVPILQRSRPALAARHYGVGPTVDTREESVATFGLDVDTASWALARTFLQAGQLPPPEAVRVEDFLQPYPDPTHAPGDRVSVRATLVPSPFRAGYHVLHLSIAAPRAVERRAPRHHVVALDVGGRMRGPHGLAAAKEALRRWLDELPDGDELTLVAFDASARTIVSGQPVADSGVRRVIAGLRATNSPSSVQAALDLGAALAAPHGGRLALITAGDATDVRDGPRIPQGVSVDVIGAGGMPLNDALLDRVARDTGGRYAYADDAAEALVELRCHALGAAARDAAALVAFDPTKVSRWRLLGYESRTAGPDGAAPGADLPPGQRLTVLFEVRLTGAAGTIATARITYRRAAGGPRETVTATIPNEPLPLLAAPTHVQLAMAAGAFAEKLRGSYWARTTSWPTIRDLAGTSDLARLVQAAADLQPRASEETAPVAAEEAP